MALLLTALAVAAFLLGRDTSIMGAPVRGAPGRTTYTAGASLRALRDLLPDDVCVSNREDSLLCTERSRYNDNTFGLRFGKRHSRDRIRDRIRDRSRDRSRDHYYQLYPLPGPLYPLPGPGRQLLPRPET